MLTFTGKNPHRDDNYIFLELDPREAIISLLETE